MHIELDGKELGIKFSACHFIPFHSKCGRLHGHNYYVSIKLEGEQGENGMLHDFIDLKRSLKKTIEILDHRVILAGNNKDTILEINDEIDVKVGNKHYVFPPEDCVVLDLRIISAEELARYFTEEIRTSIDFPENVKQLAVRVEEGKGQGAWYETAL